MPAAGRAISRSPPEREGGIVTGLDFSGEMLARARRKSTTVEWVQGDLLQLPYADSTFDAATVGFGVRNVDDLERPWWSCAASFVPVVGWRSSRSPSREGR